MHGRLSWLSVSFLLHVKYTILYRIVLAMAETICLRRRTLNRVKPTSLLWYDNIFLAYFMRTGQVHQLSDTVV